MFRFNKKRKVDAAFDAYNKEHTLRRFEDIKSILVLFDYKDWAAVLPVLEDLVHAGKTVTVWTVQKNNDPKGLINLDPQAGFSLRVLTSKDCSVVNILPEKTLAEFKALEYDTLIDLTARRSFVMSYLLANNNADFCIGLKEIDYKMYDFIVLRDNQNLKDIFDQIKFYLGNVKAE